MYEMINDYVHIKFLYQFTLHSRHSFANVRCFARGSRIVAQVGETGTGYG